MPKSLVFYLFRCSNLDCNKVFEGYEYEKHTSCISETERYAGKYLKSLKESKNQKSIDEKLKGIPKSTIIMEEIKLSNSINKLNSKYINEAISICLKQKLNKIEWIKIRKLWKCVFIYLKSNNKEINEAKAKKIFIKELVNGNFTIKNAKYILNYNLS